MNRQICHMITGRARTMPPYVQIDRRVVKPSSGPMNWRSHVRSPGLAIAQRRRTACAGSRGPGRRTASTTMMPTTIGQQRADDARAQLGEVLGERHPIVGRRPASCAAFVSSDSFIRKRAPRQPRRPSALRGCGVKGRAGRAHEWRLIARDARSADRSALGPVGSRARRRRARRRGLVARAGCTVTVLVGLVDRSRSWQPS